LGYTVSSRTVRRYRNEVLRRPPSQSWRTFLQNHAKDIWAVDLFTVQTATLRTLHAIVFIAHDRHRIVHVSGIRHPTAEWVWRQLLEAVQTGAWITGVRGHALHPLAGRQVEAGDAFGGEVDGPAPVLVEWAECNRQAAETFRDVYPPTAYFPLIVSEQLMIEPIGTESRESIERLANALIAVAEEARAGPLMLLRIG
jgi:hypothetical protein